MDEADKIIEEAKKYSPEASNHKINTVHPNFFDGSLYVVDFLIDGKSFHNYVFSGSDGIQVFRNEALLISMISGKSKRNDLVHKLGGIAGIIGLIITLAIVYIFISNPAADIPQVLSAALTSILGFYFGSQSTKK